MRILHLGCGRKQWPAAQLLAHVGLWLPDAESAEVIHLDADPANKPDLVCTLGRDSIPLPEASINLVVAWHVLEHVGRQGEVGEWFQCWEELYRVLTPGGLLYGEAPYYTSIWAWSDPSHVRAISEHSFVFFAQDSYRVEGSMISPYRVACDFQWAAMPGLPAGYARLPDRANPGSDHLRFAMAAIKPLRPWWQDATVIPMRHEVPA